MRTGRGSFAMGTLLMSLTLGCTSTADRPRPPPTEEPPSYDESERWRELMNALLDYHASGASITSDLESNAIDFREAVARLLEAFDQLTPHIDPVYEDVRGIQIRAGKKRENYETRAARMAEFLAQIRAALKLVEDDPANLDSAETQLRSIADELGGATEPQPAMKAAMVDLYYLLSTPPSGALRFEPRQATPVFVVAVSSWVSLQAFTRIPFSDPARNIILKRADRLFWIASHTAGAVQCTTRTSGIEQSCPPTNPCEPVYCVTDSICFDQILNTYESVESKTELGRCKAPFSDDADRGRAKAVARYAPEGLEQIAFDWRALVQ